MCSLSLTLSDVSIHLGRESLGRRARTGTLFGASSSVLSDNSGGIRGIVVGESDRTLLCPHPWTKAPETPACSPGRSVCAGVPHVCHSSVPKCVCVHLSKAERKNFSQKGTLKDNFNLLR